jgi:hypothetical protein
MKKVLCFMTMAVTLGGLLHAQGTAKNSGDKSKGTAYIGLTSLPVSTSDFKDVHISDWQVYGLKSVNPLSNEARVNLPLSGKAVSGQNFGLAFGGELYFSESLRGFWISRWL